MGFIDNQWVRFQIIKPNPKAGKYIAAGAIVFVATYLIGRFVFGLVEFFLEGLIGLVVIVLTVSAQYLKSYDSIGMVEFYSDAIVFIMGSNKKEFALKDISVINFKLIGIKGMPPEGSTSGMSNGTGNRVKLTTHNEVLEGEVLVSNEMKMRILERLFDYYEMQGIKIERGEKQA